MHKIYACLAHFQTCVRPHIKLFQKPIERLFVEVNQHRMAWHKKGNRYAFFKV
jgi:hypothetical protein